MQIAVTRVYIININIKRRKNFKEFYNKNTYTLKN